MFTFSVPNQQISNSKFFISFLDEVVYKRENLVSFTIFLSTKEYHRGSDRFFKFKISF